jgi:SAM-dependent methyltransferase
VADVGCGGGVDSVAFASIVGPGGTVFAQDIASNVLADALKRSLAAKLENVVPVLGHTEDPRLPDGTLDLIYMRQVFHHFAKPREMLRHLWADLKPGGRMVIVDQEKGPLKTWVDTATRERKHTWTGETTVVRLAREAGFEFVDALDDLWYEQTPFVLVFRRPLKQAARTGDPDRTPPIKPGPWPAKVPLPVKADANVVFVGLEEGRAVLTPLRERLGSGATIWDVVLEEWALTTNEVPAQAGTGPDRVLRTEKGELTGLPGICLDAVVFADAYHRLWDPERLLKQLQGTLAADGLVLVFDRRGPMPEARRLAGHRRRIAPELVRADFARAGFGFVRELKSPWPGRFLLVFQRLGG